MTSENTLRHKPPSGTLNASYEAPPQATQGRSRNYQQQAYHQHSAPTESGRVSNGNVWHVSLPSPYSRYGQEQLQQGLEHREGHGAFFSDDLLRAQSRQFRMTMPFVDSVLDQRPVVMPQLSQQYAGGQPVPNVYQPSFQNILGPTSNEAGPFGPYWPNGTYVPYRPAALENPRFHHYNPTALIGPVSHREPQSQEWNTMQHLHAGMWGQHHSASNHSLGLLNTQDASARNSGSQFVPQAFDPKRELIDSSQHHHAPNQHWLSYPSHCLPSAQIDGAWPHQSGTVPDFGNPEDHERYRERVLAWAHKIYIRLLGSIQQARRSSRQGKPAAAQMQSPRAIIFPQPLQRSSSNLPLSWYSGETEFRHSRTSPIGKLSWHQPNAASSNLNEERSRRSQCEDLNQVHRRSRSTSGRMLPGIPHDIYNAVQNPPRKQLMAMQHPGGLPVLSSHVRPTSPSTDAAAALELLSRLCHSNAWQWVDGLLLGGCLAYGLGEYEKALQWYSRILEIDEHHAEATSNKAAVLLALNCKQEAEQQWLQVVRSRPSYFEAVENLVGLLSGDHRGKDAVNVIEFVEQSLKCQPQGDFYPHRREPSQCQAVAWDPRMSAPEISDTPFFDYKVTNEQPIVGLQEPCYSARSSTTLSGYNIPAPDNGRMLALVHAKGNMLYALGDSVGAAKAFESAIMISFGHSIQGISDLVDLVLARIRLFASHSMTTTPCASTEPILLTPEKALQTVKLCFPPQGELPGLREIPSGMARKAALSTTSNSLLSLAKIFQDGMSSNSAAVQLLRASSGIREILPLYYLSLALQPSPSTANNVGILLAGVQSATPARDAEPQNDQNAKLLGVVSGSGIDLALKYYNYGLNLDNRHAHLYTNLGSLLKDLGHLQPAIKMYEQAVLCDSTFDIALANLANAVKDQGRIADAIGYYKRAVQASPDFAEAVCGLANSLNSVCGWKGRGGVVAGRGRHDRWHVDDDGMLIDSMLPNVNATGWIKRVADIIEKQLRSGEGWGLGLLHRGYATQLFPFLVADDSATCRSNVFQTISGWAGNKLEGAKIVRLIERITRRIVWRWYQDLHVKRIVQEPSKYGRPPFPPSLSIPVAPTVLPFHTFTFPVSAKQVRAISQRNGLRISCSTLKASWLPPIVYPPPEPPSTCLRIGYVSSDFNNHPLAHLMQSVFGLHDHKRVKAYCYATTPSDKSIHRQQIEREAPVFYDASSWSHEVLVGQIASDGIHILVNLNGYTRGARNEIFAARPAPVQMAFMGFAGTLGAEWCDYLLADDTAVPLDTLRPCRNNVDLEDLVQDGNYEEDNDHWVYSENIVFCRDTFFCCDHKQSAPDAKDGQSVTWEAEQRRRWAMRKELFPNLPDDFVIFGNFNQLYKVDPTTFRTWLRILASVPNSILWLLRFPDLGEANLKATAAQWAGQEIASRVWFTDVAPKQDHIARAKVVDLFLDTPECNAHTTAADVLWSGTPLLTLCRYEYKMCSRMAASILKGALPKTEKGAAAAKELIVGGDEEYEERAVELARGLAYPLEAGRRGKGVGRLADLRKMLFSSRWTSALFDTRRWVTDLEHAYREAWRRWVAGQGGDIWLKTVVPVT